VRAARDAGHSVGHRSRWIPGARVRIDYWKKLGVSIHVGNLLDHDSLKGIMKDVTDVYHNAAIVVNEAVSKEIMFKVNFEGTQVLIDEFLKEKTTSKFIQASTLGVYGFNYPKYPIKETYKLKPANNYQYSKLLAEEALLKAHNEHGMYVSMIRNSLIVGPRDTVTSLRVAQGLINGSIPYLGKGTNEFSMVDARDSSRAMITAAKNPAANGECFNIKSFDINQKDYFNFYADACNVARPSKQYPKWLALTFAFFKELTTPKGKEVLITRTRVNRYTAIRLLDITKIKEKLNFEPKHTDANKVIKESVDWLIHNNYLDIKSAKSKLT
ncbi:MAG: NAD-dependent epimerase/dehydratase family protein, partial [Asgard group archaeon]|nr:NAD-dependent epimerase/dehydratase family protein [Asgard group archaeon]